MNLDSSIHYIFQFIHFKSDSLKSWLKFLKINVKWNKIMIFFGLNGQNNPKKICSRGLLIFEKIIQFWMKCLHLTWLMGEIFNISKHERNRIDRLQPRYCALLEFHLIFSEDIFLLKQQTLTYKLYFIF